MLFSTVAVQIYIPTISVQGFPSLYLSPAITVCEILMIAILGGVK